MSIQIKTIQRRTKYMVRDFSELTRFIPALKKGNFGKWYPDKQDPDSLIWPHMVYTDEVDYFLRILKKDYMVGNYQRILESNGIKWGIKSMSEADVSNLDATCIFALFTGAVRAERFCDGALLEFFENGSMLRWLERLAEIDAAE